MIEEQVNQRLSLRAVTSQRAVPAPHTAIGAILAAEIRDFNHGPHKNLWAESAGGTIGGSFMQGFLSGTARLQVVSGRKERAVNHAPK
jgi:hypothetical protein